MVRARAGAPAQPDRPRGRWPAARYRAWEGIVRAALGLPTGEPGWLDLPALSRLTVSGPELLTPFKGLNEGKPYGDQVKPFNVRPFGHPAGVDPARFQLVAPFEKDPGKWAGLPWTNRATGVRFRIATADAEDGPNVARVKTDRDVLRELRGHPEAKSAGPDGRPCGRGTVGLLRRRTVRPAYAVHVGKEANNLEAVEAGLEHDPEEVWTEYADPARDPWATLVLPVLRAMPVAELEGLGLHRRGAFAIRAGGAAAPPPQPASAHCMRCVVRMGASQGFRHRAAE